MKVTMARIRLYLKEGKTLSDGTNPIMLMVSFNGRKEVSTGFSCIPKYWDKKSESVKKGFPNYAAINASINRLKNDAIEKRNEFERLGLKYTPAMILSKKKAQTTTVSSSIDSLIDLYIEEKGLMKTSVPVKIRILKGVNIYNEMLIGLRMFRNRYFLPFFDGDLNASLDKKKGMVSYSLSILRPKLKKHFEAINNIIIQRNVDNGTSIPLIDMDCNYYSCRHSFAMNYMLKGGTPMALATLLGRSPNTLAQYISELTEESDLVDAVDVMM